MIYDAIVVGLGCMGSAAVYSLNRRGLSVLGLERFTPFHNLGSSHGETRIFRRSLSDPDLYGELLDLAERTWRQLEQESEQKLFHRVGTLVIGDPDTGLLQQTLGNARKWGFDTSLFTETQLSRKFPRFKMQPGERAFLEKESGFLLSDACMRNQQNLAQAAGAQLRFEERVNDWAPTQTGVEVNTDKTRYQARKLVVTVGPWFQKFFPELSRNVGVERQNVIWVETPEGFRYPTFDWELDEEVYLYGIPSPGGGKVGLERRGKPTDPDLLNREVEPQDLEDMLEQLRPRIPQLAALPLAASSGCLYTRHPSERFLLGPHPDCGKVILAGVFQGLGFKFAGGVGEVLADLVQAGGTELRLGAFQPS